MEYKVKSKFKLIFFVFSILLIAFLAVLLCRYLPKKEKASSNNEDVLFVDDVAVLNEKDYQFREELIDKTKKKDYSKVLLKIKDKEIDTEVVFSSEAKAQGLSNRESLENGEAMLFLMSKEDHPNFVMREMNFPLDIVFINKGEVVKVFHQAEPEGITYRRNYNYGPADMVLELPGGYFVDNNLELGASISFVK